MQESSDFKIFPSHRSLVLHHPIPHAYSQATDLFPAIRSITAANVTEGEQRAIRLSSDTVISDG